MIKNDKNTVTSVKTLENVKKLEQTKTELISELKTTKKLLKTQENKVTDLEGVNKAQQEVIKKLKETELIPAKTTDINNNLQADMIAHFKSTMVRSIKTLVDSIDIEKCEFCSELIDKYP